MIRVPLKIEFNSSLWWYLVSCYQVTADTLKMTHGWLEESMLSWYNVSSWSGHWSSLVMVSISSSIRVIGFQVINCDITTDLFSLIKYTRVSDFVKRMFLTNRLTMSKELLRQSTPFILSPYIMILCCCCSAGKLMIRLYLETFQHYKDSHLDSYPVSHLQTVKSWLRQYVGVTNLDFCWYYETSLMTEWKLIKYEL